MKTKALIIVSVVAPLIGFSAIENTTGPVVSQQVINQAKAAGKMILVGNGTFGDSYVEDFLTRNFVIQKTDSDKETAFLVYDQEGVLVHRVVGETKYPYELAVKIKKGLDERTQYYSLLARFENGERAPELLENAIMGANDANDSKNGQRLMQAYLDTLPTAPDAQQLNFVSTYTNGTTDPGFALLLEKQFDIEKLADILFAEAFLPHLDSKKVDTTALTASLKTTYPSAALIARIDRMVIDLLEMREDRAALSVAIPNYLATYKQTLSDAQVDYYNWLLHQ